MMLLNNEANWVSAEYTDQIACVEVELVFIVHEHDTIFDMEKWLGALIAVICRENKVEDCFELFFVSIKIA